MCRMAKFQRRSAHLITYLHEGVEVDFACAQDGMLTALFHFSDGQGVAFIDFPQPLHLFTSIQCRRTTNP